MTTDNSQSFTSKDKPTIGREYTVKYINKEREQCKVKDPFEDQYSPASNKIFPRDQWMIVTEQLYQYMYAHYRIHFEFHNEEKEMVEDSVATLVSRMTSLEGRMAEVEKAIFAARERVKTKKKVSEVKPDEEKVPEEKPDNIEMKE